MKRTIMISLFAMIIAVISGCTDVSSTSTEVKDTPAGKSVVQHKKAVKTQTAEETDNTVKEVQLDHLKLNVSSKWDVELGSDSAAFSVDGKPVGLIEGLPYAETVEALLPNQAIATNKQKLDGLAFEAYQVTTSTDAVQSTNNEETHIYLFIEPKKEVYDLHFNANSVDEKTILQIARTAK